MQSVSESFNQASQAGLRKLAQQVRISFDKTYQDGVTFFELDSSVLDGTDILAPSDDNVVQEWDHYDYTNYSDRVVQVEWTREEDIPYSVSSAIADVTFKNTDNFFTRGSSPLDPYILPRRPIRLLSGFDNTSIPQFVGLTESVPIVDRAARTASVSCIDFLSFLFNKPLDQTIILEDKTTDQVLDYLFQLFGLTPSQYVLDEGFNRISFIYWEKGEKLGKAVKGLMQAEMGSLYMDELGIIRFRNRVKSSTDAVMSFDETNIIDYRISDESKIINVVEIKANILKVQPSQVIYTLSEPILVLSGDSREVFLNLFDPITSLETITTYLANSQEDGQGTNLTANISIAATDVFAKAVKLTIDNSGDDAYITELELEGTPAKAIGPPLYIRLEDEDSVAEFEEQVLTIDNDFIQTNDAANSLGLSIINYYKDYANTIELDVKGNPALQLGDNIDVNIDDIADTFTITKIVNILENQGRYIQRITGKVFNIADFFIISSDDEARSLLNGEDVLAP